jgi:bla regulator protein BlaR1
MHFSSHLLNEAAMAAFWTLMHFLWQGLLLVILTGLVMVSTRRSRPAVRYRLLSALMVLFVIRVATTFAREWSGRSTLVAMGQALVGGAANGVVHAVGESSSVAPAVGGARRIAAVIDASIGIAERVNRYLSAHAALIVMVWLVILGVRLGRMWWALNYTRHIRSRGSHVMPEYWTSRLEELCVRLKLSRPVRILESAVLKVPVAFGHLKPVIFIPIGLFAKLPPEQAEAILLHELAHIRRDDYLMNVLQSMAEHLFFFNPGVCWLSSLLREERENCCDDMAIAETGDKKQLVRALIGFRELSSLANPVYEMGFAGRRNVFVNRIARIVHNKSKGLTAGEGVFFGFSVLLIGFLAMAFKQGGPQTPGIVHKVVVAQRDTLPAAKTDTVPQDDDSERDRMVSLDVDLPHGKQVLIAMHKGQRYHITQVNGVVTELSIGDKPVPTDKIEGYGPTIRRIYGNLDRVRIEKMDGEETETSGMSPNDWQHRIEETKAARASLLQRIAELNEEQDTAIARQQTDFQAQQEKLQRDIEEETQALAKQQIEQQAELERVLKVQLQESGIVSMMLEAVKWGIVSDVAEIRSLRLTKDMLLINGKKQSTAVQGAFSKKFILTPQMEFHFESSDK